MVCQVCAGVAVIALQDLQAGGGNKMFDILLCEEPVAEVVGPGFLRRDDEELFGDDAGVGVVAALHLRVACVAAEAVGGFERVESGLLLREFDGEAAAIFQRGGNGGKQAAIVVIRRGADLSEGCKEADGGVKGMGRGVIFGGDLLEFDLQAGFAGPLFGGFYHGCRGVDAEDMVAAPGELYAVAAEAAADVEDASAGGKRQRVDQKVDFLPGSFFRQ